MVDIHCEGAGVSDSVFYVPSDCHCMLGRHLVDHPFLSNVMSLCFLTHIRLSFMAPDWAQFEFCSRACLFFVHCASIYTTRACGQRFSENVPGKAKADGQFLPRRLVVGLQILRRPDITNLPSPLQLKNAGFCHL